MEAVCLEAICSARTWAEMCRQIPEAEPGARNNLAAVRIHVVQDEAERKALAERLASQGRDVIHIR